MTRLVVDLFLDGGAVGKNLLSSAVWH